MIDVKQSIEDVRFCASQGKHSGGPFLRLGTELATTLQRPMHHHGHTIELSAAKKIRKSKSWFRPQRPRQQFRWLKSVVGDERRRLRSGAIRFRGSCIVVAMLLVSGGVRAQYTNGGEVSMSCGECECTGSSDDGEVEVFDNPYSGERTAYVANEYSEILDTSCGASVIAAGDTLYELNGVDLPDRELHELSMSSSDCTTKSSSDECYSGTFSDSLDGGIEMSLDICVCVIGDDVYQTNTEIRATGTTSANVNGIEVCIQHGFVGYLVTAELGENSYRYKFDLVIPGQDSSADLSVSSAPGSDAGAFMCGDVKTDTSGSESETGTEMPTPTPEPPVPTPGPETPEPTPSPIGPEPTLSPVGPEPTLSPVGPEPTPSPVSPEATQTPLSPPVPNPVPNPVPTPPEAEVEPETPSPTTSPSLPPDPQTITESSSTTDSTTASTTDSTQATTPVPEPTEPTKPETDAPVNDPPVTDSTATDPPLEDDYWEESNQPSPVPENDTPAPTATQEATPAPVAAAATTSAPTATQWPTPAPTVSGSSGTPGPVEAPTGETPAPTGVSNSPAPTALTPSPASADPEDSIISRFDDTEMNLSRGEGFAVATLGIFTVLTFLPAPHLY